VLSFVLATYGAAYGNADPARALDAFRRGLAIAQDGGIRFIESQVSYNLARLENLHTRARDEPPELPRLRRGRRRFRRPGRA
jgi:hypothetical protein